MPAKPMNTSDNMATTRNTTAGPRAIAGTGANSRRSRMPPTSESTAVKAQLAGMVSNCPSGALTFRLAGATGDLEPDLAPGVKVVDDGPLWVTGGVPVVRADGEPCETRNRVALCRCGASANKPLCDGSHAKVEFRDGPAT